MNVKHWVLAVLIVGAFFVLAPAAPAAAEPALWKLTGPHATVYLFGTVHFLKPGTQWRSPKIDAAFASASTLWEELADAGDLAAAATLHKVLVGLSQALIVLPIPGLLGHVLPDSLALTAAGFGIEIAGLGIAISARRQLGRNWSAEVRIAHDHALVRDGVYAHLRHPIYTGALCMYAGFTLISGTVHALLGFVLVCLAYARKIQLEERILAQRFGAEFDQYRRESRAVIPLIL